MYLTSTLKKIYLIQFNEFFRTKIFFLLKYFTKSALISCLLLSYSCLFAHHGSIKGTIYDSETKLPLIGANIWLNSTEKGTVTNEFGVYRFQHLEAGVYQVKVSFIGFEAQEFAVEVKEDMTANSKNLSEEKQFTTQRNSRSCQWKYEKPTQQHSSHRCSPSTDQFFTRCFASCARFVHRTARWWRKSRADILERI